MKYVVVSGGVMSGLGKGISSSSIGLLLQASGCSVTSIKIDPYLNTDAGTMSPFEHGEVYVLDDGGEVDLDLGNYERFLGTTLTKDHNITTGKVYQKVIDAERRGDYLGKTVQVIPHITNAIQEWIETVAVIPVDGTQKTPDVCIIELGGTVGDIESMVFLEALRQFEYRVGSDNICHVHVSLVPVSGGEPKSKPTQHAVRELRAAGLPPDFIFCRSTERLVKPVITKLAQFCMVPPSHVISVHDVSNIMRVPLILLEQDIPALILSSLRLNRTAVDSIPLWRSLADRIDQSTQVIKIAMVGKYTGLTDAYLSVSKSLYYAAIHSDVKVDIVWIEADELEEATKISNPPVFENAWKRLSSCNGVLVPGGFGSRGVEGMILAAHYARNKKVPYFGICLGLQVAVIEYCRSKLGLTEANSEEFNPNSADTVIAYMPEHNQEKLGGTMRLGAHSTAISRGSLAHYLYGRTHIVERHRHRYEVNPEYITRIQEAGGRFTGTDSSRKRMEIFEIGEEHPFYIGAQFHPEFLSRPLSPSPIFLGFILASANKFDRNVRHTGFPEFAGKSSQFQWDHKHDVLTEEILKDEETLEKKCVKSHVVTPKLFIPDSPLVHLRQIEETPDNIEL